MSLEEYLDNPLWPHLVETVHAMVMFPHHKAYARDVILHEQPNLTTQELAIKLGITLGEALVILHELQNQEPKESTESENASET